MEASTPLNEATDGDIEQFKKSDDSPAGILVPTQNIQSIKPLAGSTVYNEIPKEVSLSLKQLIKTASKLKLSSYEITLFNH